MYGENGALLRTELTALLKQHRVQLKIGGDGCHTIPATTSRIEREHLGDLIRRYRQSALVWAQEASRAVAPYAASNLTATIANPFTLPTTEHGGLRALQHALDQTVAASSAALPGLDELVTPHDLPLVEHWRHVARAAALGEHDFGAGLHHHDLDANQTHTLIADVAAVVRALVVLDQRYKSIPGWERLRLPERLGWSALACALDASLEPPDYSVDLRGWRAPTKLLAGPPRPGLLGVLQAERDLAVRLKTFPNVMNLRALAHSQALVSAGLAEFIAKIDPDLHERFGVRQGAYLDLENELRNVGCRIGMGGTAVAEGANAVSRLRALPRDATIDQRVLHAFPTLFNKIDAQIADHIEYGIDRKAYLKRVTLPRLVENSGQLVAPPRERYTAFPAEPRPAILDLVRDRLRPNPEPATAPRAAARSRAELHAAIVHQAHRRPGPPLSL